MGVPRIFDNPSITVLDEAKQQFLISYDEFGKALQIVSKDKLGDDQLVAFHLTITTHLDKPASPGSTY
jgi:hypothetical protein